MEEDMLKRDGEREDDSDIVKEDIRSFDCVAGRSVREVLSQAKG